LKKKETLKKVAEKYKNKKKSRESSKLSLLL
jgi:hypothetical protein